MTQHLKLETLVLAKGSHTRRAYGVCLFEAVAWFAGRKHTDAPECVSPVLRAFGMRFNDALSGGERQRLVPYIPRLIGTAGNLAADERRGWMATDWLIRTYAPAWLRVAGLDAEASRLAGAEEIHDPETLARVKPALEQARVRAARAAEVAGADWAARAAWAAWAAEVARAAEAARAAEVAGVAGAAWAAEAAWAAWAAWAVRAAGAAGDAGVAGVAGDAWAAEAAWAAWQSTIDELKRSAWELWERMVALGEEAA